MRTHGFSGLSGLFLASLMALLAATPASSQDTNAQCMLQFDAVWSVDTHPINFPPDAHFSPLIGGNHDDQTVFWQMGSLASPGIQEVAETGATGTFTAEVNDAIDAGGAEAVISGGAVGLSPGMAQAQFEVSLEHSRITVVTMIAPSPDWFVGVNGLDLFAQGGWRSSTIVDLLPYDAGTDSGASFNSPDQPTVPAETIFQITQSPFPNGVPLGTFSIVCDSALVFTDGFESGDLGTWTGTAR